MQCPKCEEGTLIKILFKKTKKFAYICDYCSAMWIEGEHISELTGRSFESYAQEQGNEYAITELEPADWEHQPATFPEFK